MGRALTGPEVLETRLTRFLEVWLRRQGIESQRQPVAPGRDNLLARFEPAGSRRTLLFDVHQDTVPSDGMSIEPFHPRIENERLWGRGSCDVKGGMASMLVAFSRLCRERPKGAASVVLACTVDEEFTHTGVSKLAEETGGVDLAVVAEPTLLDLVHCHKGALRCKIRTRGVACHSSTPQNGINAIYRMSRVVGALSEYAAVLHSAAADPIVGPPSLSVGRIEGGQSVNIVPDWCEIELDRRLIPGEQPAAAIKALRDFLGNRLGSFEHVEIDPPWINLPPLEPRLESWIPPLKEAVRRARGDEPRVVGVPYGTDAGLLGAAGVPCVVFGPGDIAQAHTTDEWIDLTQVRQAAEAYYQMALVLG
jgi:acetylornithine deacetylase